MEQHIRNLANRNAGSLVLIHLEYELRAVDQSRFTVDGVHFDTIEGEIWMNRAFQDRFDELKVDLFDTGVLSLDAAADVRAISSLVPPSLDFCLGSVPVVSETARSSRDPEARSDVMER